MRFTSRALLQPESPIAALGRVLDRRPHLPRLIDVSQGAPSYGPPPVVTDVFASASRQAGSLRYTPIEGLVDLRAAYAERLSTDYFAELSAADVMITGGANQAFCLAISVLAEPGDEVVLTDPYFFNHDMWLRLNGITAVYAQPNPQDFAEAITPRTRAMVLVSPSNPTGLAFEAEELDEFIRLAVNSNVPLLIDETYRDFSREPEPHHRLFAHPNWRDHFVGLHSFSKQYALPGARVGALIAGPEFIDHAKKYMDCVAICAPSLSQLAVLTALEYADEWVEDRVEEVADKRHGFQAVFDREPGGFKLRSSGAFYGWVKHPWTDITAVEATNRLVLEHGIATLPGSAFSPSGEQFLRFSFVNVSMSQIDELATRLASTVALR